MKCANQRNTDSLTELPITVQKKKQISNISINRHKYGAKETPATKSLIKTLLMLLL